MKRMIVGMKKQFVKEFVEWLNENDIKVCGEPYEAHGIWNVMYMPIGKEQKQKCEEYIKYRCNSDLL